jgi:hypothetical protein
VRWALYGVLYMIGVFTLGLLLFQVERTIAAALDLIFLVLAVVLFRLALKDISTALDIAIEERERIELRMAQILLIVTFLTASSILGYGFLKALFPFV